MTDADLEQLLSPLNDYFAAMQSAAVTQPLLAHYTSVTVLESVLRNEELWFSNPLLMNDTQEVRFVINESRRLFDTLEIEQACGSAERYRQLLHYYDHVYLSFADKEVLETYIFCLSEHEPDDTDGRLSMWRGYGANGNGVAIVFDSSKVTALEESPLIIMKVTYATKEEQEEWLSKYLIQFCALLKDKDLTDDQLWHSIWTLFEHIKIYALCTKHRGFHEEEEWRVVYFRNRDHEQLLDSMFGYWIGPRGLEPKLKFKLKPLRGVTAENFSLIDVVDRIILGPTASSPLSKAIVLKMLDHLGKAELQKKVFASSIPFRAL